MLSLWVPLLGRIEVAEDFNKSDFADSPSDKLCVLSGNCSEFLKTIIVPYPCLLDYGILRTQGNLTEVFFGYAEAPSVFAL